MSIIKAKHGPNNVLTVVELVRHAKAASRADWRGGPDSLRPLTGKGRRQAHALAEDLLREGAVEAIYSSPLTRCRQTCEPLAEWSGRSVVTEARIGEVEGIPVADNGSAWVASAWLGGRAVGLLDEAVQAHRGGRVVVCSHGDVIPSLLAVLAGRDGVDAPEVRLAKGQRATLRFEDGRCAGIQRIPLPEPSPV